MTLELRADEFEIPQAKIEGPAWRPGLPALETRERALGAQPELSEVSPDLIERLARQLALMNGEDPDEQPHPLRYPRWRFYCGRAKALLSISPEEHLALATVRRSR